MPAGANKDDFNIATIKESKIYMYADDMVLTSRSQEELQIAFDRLTEWANENDLQLNDKKTVMMVFRKGGRLPRNTGITYNGTALNGQLQIGVTLKLKETYIRNM
ncbi:hypothetical protein ANN_02073 [Periplaneta americana]|uniref:Reverse transcriptase domain-containing protein n=1 Tax=Periplaneta americana TaxID=6978 RepID=A0ABQ8TVC9_PERAM|nr:hypothetical protein ANN_02073 [Periplaneta americana]